MPPIPPPHLSQKVVKKCKIAAKEKSLGESVVAENPSGKDILP